MLHGAICPVTLAVSAAGIAGASYFAYRSGNKPSAIGFGTVTAMIFAAQMLNFPISHGTSGHILGGLLAVSLLGTPYAILSITLVLAVQAVFFGDGGISTLGANVINMAFVGAGLGGALLNLLNKQGVSKNIALGVSSWAAVVLASVLCSFELASAGSVVLSKILPTMVSVHCLIGLGEAVATVGLVVAINKVGIRKYAPTSFALAFAAALVSPWASSLPDGLEWAMGHQISAINVTIFSTIAGALSGVFLVFILAYTAAGLIKRISFIGGQYARC